MSWLSELPPAEQEARRRQFAEFGTANNFEFYKPHVTLAYRDDAQALGNDIAGLPPLEHVDIVVSEIHVSPKGSRGVVPRGAATSVVRLAGPARSRPSGS